MSRLSAIYVHNKVDHHQGGILKITLEIYPSCDMQTMKKSSYLSIQLPNTL